MRRFTSSACFALGAVWATAGAFKLLFGVSLTLPILPPVGLERVAAWPSIAVGVVLVGVGALLARRDYREVADISGGVTNATPQLMEKPAEFVARASSRETDRHWT